ECHELVDVYFRDGWVDHLVARQQVGGFGGLRTGPGGGLGEIAGLEVGPQVLAAVVGHAGDDDERYRDDGDERRDLALVGPVSHLPPVPRNVSMTSLAEAANDRWPGMPNG